MIKLYEFINKCSPKSTSIKIKYHEAYENDHVLFAGPVREAEDNLVFDNAGQVYEITNNSMN